MLHAIVVWLLVPAFAGAGVFNALGGRGTQDSFVRWGYPAWWSRVTGPLELAAAAAIAVPTTRGAGLILGALITAAAVITVARRREFAHLAPLALFAALLAAAALTA
jgi:hypothetical protein